MSGLYSARSLEQTYLEYGLHLGEIGPRVRAGEHLDDQTPHTPDIRFESVTRLLDYFGRHPEHAAL